MSIIITRLAFLLKQKGISQSEIGRRLGKHSSFVSRKMNSDSMETKLLEEILHVTGLSLKELICDPIENLDIEEGLLAKIDQYQAQLDLLREEVNKQTHEIRPHGKTPAKDDQ